MFGGTPRSRREHRGEGGKDAATTTDSPKPESASEKALHQAGGERSEQDAPEEQRSFEALRGRQMNLLVDDDLLRPEGLRRQTRHGVGQPELDGAGRHARLPEE